ncbi:MAG: type II toxin-antitoxin system RelE/ParE family toxin [Pseudomonadota bacterium]
MKLLELCGNNLRLPHSRSLGQGLFELRERRYGLRVYYTYAKTGDIVLLHSGDKNNQPKDIFWSRSLLNKMKR